MQPVDKKVRKKGAPYRSAKERSRRQGALRSAKERLGALLAVWSAPRIKALPALLGAGSDHTRERSLAPGAVRNAPGAPWLRERSLAPGALLGAPVGCAIFLTFLSTGCS